MDGVGSVADKRQALGHEAAGDLKVERERLARTGDCNVAELGAEALGKLGEECRLISRHDRFPHCPDILVNCTYDAEANEVAPFEEFMGSHGGLGGWQMRPFALVPAFWSRPESPIVGVRAMHDELRGWLAETGLELRPHSRL
jgi:hypothetical protein